MVPKSLVPALIGAAVLLMSGAASADQYRADEFLGLDLSTAVLSPKRLGPPTAFAPVAVEDRSDASSETHWARDALKTEPRKVAVENVKVTHPHRPTHVAASKPRGAARARLAHRHGNPLNAEAMDTRIQKWPCKSDGGGICDWK